MGKFASASTSTGGLSALEKMAQTELPTGPAPEAAPAPAPEAAPQAAPIGSDLTQQPQAQPQQALEEIPTGLPEVGGTIDETFAEVERQAIPDLRKRWKESDPVNKATATTKVDGGIFDRANRMASAVETGQLLPAISLSNTAGWDVAQQGGTGPEVAEAIAADKAGSLIAAVNRVGAVTNADPRNPQFDPDYIKAASLVTENMMAELSTGTNGDIVETENDPVAAAMQEEVGNPIDTRTGAPRQIAKAQANGRIGQMINQEFQRLKGQPVPEKLPTAEAETVGDAFKEMWAMQNPDLVRRTRDPKTQQVYFELTPLGEDVMAKGSTDRKRLFPSKNIKPSKVPLVTGKLLGDTGQNVVKNVQGAVGKQDFGKVLQESSRNMGQIANVVDPARLKILYATVLPVLQNINNPEAYQTWEAEINNIGASKFAKYSAAEAQANADPENNQPYDAFGEMQKAAQKLANEVQSLAENRKGANYLSYATQGFQGRQSPQQSYFNPTTSKAVRFATRGAAPSIAKPGGRVEENLRQMYAMMLVKGADGKLPNQREIMLKGAEAKLEAWGKKVSESIAMSDADVEAISEAITQGMALTDPNFPQVAAPALDPAADADLIAAIKAKGEDGPAFMDGLVDFANYAAAKREGKPHASYFNAYIDGKTNGIASNGIQMGNSKTARRTGVTRMSNTDYLDKEGDVRDVLKNDLLNDIAMNGFDGNLEGFESEMTAVANAVFSHRDLNKKTTMTFGYGKEISSFSSDMSDTIALLKADPNAIKDPEMREAFKTAIPLIEGEYDSATIAETLMGIYGPALEQVMSPEALQSRSVMRSASIMFAATNQLMSIKTYTGMDMNFGRDVQEDYDQADLTSYNLKGEKVAGGKKEFTSASRKSTPTSSAERQRGEGPAQAGEFAYGGSVVGPVQSLDAATVAMTTAGKSWKRMQAASGGNAYMHTIYDAFKVDANGYDVALEEINENWLEAGMNWSYLEETKKSTETAMDTFNKDMAKRDPNATVEPNEATYMNFILAPVESKSSGKTNMINFVKKVGTAGSFEKRGMNVWDQSKRMQQVMKNVGYDWRSPPPQPTNRQLKAFVGELNNQLTPLKRLGNAVTFTNAKKKELKAEIKKHGYRTKSGKVIPLQYYAH